MPDKSDVLAATEGMLNMDLFVVTTVPAGGMEAVMENLDAHLKFQVQLEQSGVMFGAGPLWADDEQTWNGEGMVIIRADSLAHARQIAESDPMHACGARTYTVRPWLLNEGGFTVQVTYSDGQRRIA